MEVMIITPTDKMSQMLKVTFGPVLDNCLTYHLIPPEIVSLYIIAILMTNLT